MTYPESVPGNEDLARSAQISHQNGASAPIGGYPLLEVTEPFVLTASHYVRAEIGSDPSGTNTDNANPARLEFQARGLANRIEGMF